MVRVYQLLQVILVAIFLSGCAAVVTPLLLLSVVSAPAPSGAVQRFEPESTMEPSKLLPVKTIALLEIPEPPNYGRDTRFAAQNAEYGELSFGNTAQAILGSILKKNGFEVIQYSPNRENEHQLIYDYSNLDYHGADAFLDVVPVEVEYKFFFEKTGPHVSASFRLISAASYEKIYAGSIQYGWNDVGVRLRSAGVEIESPENHVFESSDILKANKTKAAEWLVLGIEAISSSIGEKIVEGKFVGLAENEIETGTYNRVLWEEVLFKASCFESQARSIYIAARVKQLSLRNSSENSSINPDNQQITVKQRDGESITGTYISEVTTSSNRVFRRKKYRQLEVKFEQVGNCILGTDESGGVKITGIREGDNISFSIQPGELANDEITGNWSIVEGGKILVGRWSNLGASGEWNLRRTE